MNTEVSVPQEQIVLQLLGTISEKIEKLATKDELREVKAIIGDLVPRKELEASNRIVERDMIEIRKAIQELHSDLNDLKKKVDSLNANRLPSWMTQGLVSLIVSMVTLFIVWAVNHGTIILSK
jgi:chromosome segregation ATPase